MTSRFDRWTLITVPVLGTVLWVFRNYGLLDGGLWRAVVGLIALVAGSLAVVQLLRKRREQDAATEPDLSPRDIK